MHDDFTSTIERAREILAELLAEYKNCLEVKVVSQRALHLTHELCDKLKRLLDRIAYRYWDQYVSPLLVESYRDRRRKQIYFPICKDDHAFKSALGKWCLQEFDGSQVLFRAELAKLQPYKTGNRVLTIMAEISNSGHVQLLPQTHARSPTISVVRSPYGTVRWNTSAVSFANVPGCEIRIFGVPLNPSSQSLISNDTVKQSFETWESFTIDAYGMDALYFCDTVIRYVNQIAKMLIEKFRL